MLGDAKNAEKVCRDLLAAKLPLRSLAGALWLYCSGLHLSPDQSSVVLGIGHRAIRNLHKQFDDFFSLAIARLNDMLTIGGQGLDVELDEISFRSVARANGVVWVRFLAIVRRGSSLVWIHRPYRVSESGQGGGGPISQYELDEAIMPWSDEPRLSLGSVCHTDGAKVYRNLASPLYNGSLMQYEWMYLGHTCVKHKPPNPEFTKKISTRVWDGHTFNNEIRWGGTQKLDGFFAGFRRVVGKRPFNTAGPSDDSRALSLEQFLLNKVRLYQFKYWFGGHDLWAVFGCLAKAARTDPDGFTWSSFNMYKPGLQSEGPDEGSEPDDMSELFEDDD